jgi:hypothetical protein
VLEIFWKNDAGVYLSRVDIYNVSRRAIYSRLSQSRREQSPSNSETSTPPLTAGDRINSD